MIRKMLSRNKTPEEIADFCGYDIEEVKVVEKEMCALVQLADTGGISALLFWATGPVLPSRGNST